MKRSSSLIWTLACAVALTGLGLGCGGEDPGRPPVIPPDSGTGCQDSDSDGYGVGCFNGEDCDDTNASITYQCRRCTDAPMSEGCPCEPQLGMECVPPPIPVADGVLVCREGTRFCRDGFWTACEPAGEGYTFVPN